MKNMPFRVLLIDDAADHLALCEYTLLQEGYSVASLPDCMQLEQTLEKFNPQLIFIDHQMPGILGDEGIRLIRANPRFRSVPIIYFSSEVNLAALARSAGADDFLAKPLDPVSLLKFAAKYRDCT